MIGFQMDEQQDELEELEEIVTSYFSMTAEELSWQRHVRTVGIRDYRTGWYTAAVGGLLCDCDSPAMEAGWWASHDVDSAMRKIGVRS